MIINNIIIENFRCFAGKNTLSFNDEGKVTVIYGNAGYGKSTFLQFIMWMLYDSPDFGVHDDMPLFNKDVYNEKNQGELISVFGQIDFTHLGLNYSLTRKYIYKVGLGNTTLVDTKVNLMSLEGDNWVNYKGNIPNKINTFLPKALSKYFLLDGEKARELVLNPKGLKLAIQDLFGLNAYTNAIEHIGTKSKKNTVLGYYNSQMMAKMPKKTSSGIDADELQAKLEMLDKKIDGFQKKSDEIGEKVELLTAEKDKLIETLGETNNQTYIKKLIDSNNATIKQKEKDIAQRKNDIGNLMYQNYPYLLLSNVASKSSAELRRKNLEISNDDHLVFENLKKDLMKEILEKGTCVCGRSLDNSTVRNIESIISIMPPDSYTYQFGQFVGKAKKQIEKAQIDVTKIDSTSMDISVLEGEINDCIKANNSYLEDMKKLDASKSIVEKIESIRDEITKLSEEKKKYDSTIASDKRTYELANKQLESILRADKVYLEFKDKIEFFEKLKSDLEKEKAEKERNIRKILNACVREVFKKLTTQTNVDADRIQFVSDDFTLRTTFLSGGQQAVDVYSYVLGIIMALEEFSADSARQETPVIVDAPFAFTDNEQSQHVFLQLPQVAKQAVLLTLDINKIKQCLVDHPEVFDLVIIRNETNTNAHFERGNIDDIKF